jgi:tRNA nucleotidyltransferase (CCA-adding enzyme)
VKRQECEEKVLSHITPLREEREHIHSVADRIIGAVNTSGKAKGMIAGSVARDTWVRGDRDLDIFMLFDPSMSREALEEHGMGLARSIARRLSGAVVEKYAEHPYVNTEIEGLSVDLVPCYAVDNAARIQSAVDRTPFHTLFVREHIGDLASDVLLLKQFAKAGGIYGSDQMTGGFAGYLCELLVIWYGGFSQVIEAASSWRPGVVIDIRGHQSKEFEDPLVVVDPVDPRRNVAASLTLTRFAEFVEFAHGYREAPSMDFFFPPVQGVLDFECFKAALGERGTYLYAIVFSTPHTIPDIVVPQLRKSLAAIAGMLDRYGFTVSRSDCCMGEARCMLLFELLVDSLPALKRHMGPYIWNGSNADDFRDKYRNGTFSGPYIEDGRYWIDIQRKHTSAGELLGSDSPLKVSLGKHVMASMQRGFTLLSGPGCWTEGFESFVSGFIRKQSPLVRIKQKREEIG